MLTFEFSEIIAKAESERVLTKRVILRTAARFYDPLGLIAPIIVVVKVMFQQLCKDKLQWDDDIGQPFQDKWRNLLTNLKQVRQISVDRCYAKEFDYQTASSIQLHGFGDASNAAYGACIYIRYENGSEIHCQLATSKSRVAPMKTQTIPRLELLAYHGITARLMAQVHEALKDVLRVDSRYCWSDSSIALAWIQSTSKEYKPFVQNRVKQSLNVVEDDRGILRCKGRLENAPIRSDSKCPILLPSDHHVTRLIIEQCHRTVMHNGLRETLTQVRTRFWISKGRQIVKKVIAKCNVCKKLEGKSYGAPLSPLFPPFRLSDDFAFSKIGLDYNGPLFVKDIYEKGGKMSKAYISLYTCASSRAIHLDLVPELSSKAFLRSFKRFVGRRGILTEVLSDNAKTFKSVEVHDYIRSIRIKWRFNVEGAPWWGGFFERLVKSVKRCLKKVVRNARLTYEELLTVLIEIEGVRRNRRKRTLARLPMSTMMIYNH